MDGILNSPEVKQTIDELPRMVVAFRQTLSTIDREVTSLSGTGRTAIVSTTADLHRTLAAVEKLAGNLDQETASTLAEARGTLADARGTFKSAGTALEGANIVLDPRGRSMIQIQRAVDDLAARRCPPAALHRTGGPRSQRSGAREVAMRSRLGVITGLLCVAISGCMASRATLVALPAAPDAKAIPAVQRSSGSSILLRPVVLPRYLDSYPVVIGRTQNTLIMSSNTEWAEPFPDAVGRVLRDALSQRLGTSRVLIAGDGRIPDADLTVEFMALDAQQRTLRVDAKWTFSCSARNRPSHGGSTFFRSPARSRNCAGRCCRYGGCFGTPCRCDRDAGRLPEQRFGKLRQRGGLPAYMPKNLSVPRKLSTEFPV